MPTTRTEEAAQVSHRIEKRQKEIQESLDWFITHWNDKTTAVRISQIENASEKLTAKYFEILDGVIKAYLKPGTKVNKFKVAAGTEIASMIILPIKIDDPSATHLDRRKVNAEFGFTIAGIFLYSIHYENLENFPGKAANNDLFPIMKTHKEWLTYLDVSNIQRLPTFLNSNFWEAYLFASTGAI